MLAVGHEVRAGGAAFAIADGLRAIVGFASRFLDFHSENLVALQPPLGVVALESEPLAVGAPVGFRVVAAESELADIFEVGFGFIGCWLLVAGCWLLVLGKKEKGGKEKKERRSLAHEKG